MSGKIFQVFNYFRHNYLDTVLYTISLLKHIWVEVEHESGAIEAGCLPVVFAIMGTSRMVHRRRLFFNIFDHLVSEVFGE